MTKNSTKESGKIELITQDNKPMVSSLVVADHFGKRHDHVLRDIKKLECPEDFNALNFGAVEYVDAKGERRPAFNMTRDGFTILAMGFTGKKAMAWKIKYIEAFNAMETKLSASRSLVEPKHEIVAADQGDLRAFMGLAKYWCYLEGISWTEGRAQIEASLKVQNLDYINALELYSAWPILTCNMSVVPKLDDSPCCSEEELTPIKGLLVYWARQEKGSPEDAAKSICKSMHIDDLKELPTTSIPHALSLIWDKINYSAGYKDALKENGYQELRFRI